MMRFDSSQDTAVHIIRFVLCNARSFCCSLSIGLFLAAFFVAVLLATAACQSPQSENATFSPEISSSAGTPSAPIKVKITQPDGYSFDVYLRGDERIAWHETANGYSIIKNLNDNVWYYAECKDNNLVPSSHRVGEALPKSWPKHLRLQNSGCRKQQTQ